MKSVVLATSVWMWSKYNYSSMTSVISCNPGWRSLDLLDFARNFI